MIGHISTSYIYNLLPSIADAGDDQFVNHVSNCFRTGEELFALISGQTAKPLFRTNLTCTKKLGKIVWCLQAEKRKFYSLEYLPIVKQYASLKEAMKTYRLETKITNASIILKTAARLTDDKAGLYQVCRCSIRERHFLEDFPDAICYSGHEFLVIRLERAYYILQSYEGVETIGGYIARTGCPSFSKQTLQTYFYHLNKLLSWENADRIDPKVCEALKLPVFAWFGNWSIQRNASTGITAFTRPLFATQWATFDPKLAQERLSVRPSRVMSDPNEHFAHLMTLYCTEMKLHPCWQITQFVGKELCQIVDQVDSGRVCAAICAIWKAHGKFPLVNALLGHTNFATVNAIWKKIYTTLTGKSSP